MVQDLNINRVRHLLNNIQRAFFEKPADVQADALSEALNYAFQTIERLEARIEALEVAKIQEQKRGGS
jgi:cob(I)alamin adenosyltransferase